MKPIGIRPLNICANLKIRYPSRYYFCISCRNHSMSLQLFMGCGCSGLPSASSDLTTQEANSTEMWCEVVPSCGVMEV